MEEPKFIFTSEPILLKAEGENFFVEGYISTSDLDQVNDIVTKACLLDMAEQMKNRTIKFDVEHESFRGKSDLDREVNKTKIPVAKTDDFLMDKKGIKVRAMLNPYSSRFDEVKGSINGGFLDAFSIAYVPVKSVIQEKNGQSVRLLDKINLLNVAFTGNPVNTEAKMTNVFAKSLEFLEEKEKGPGGHKPDKTGPHGRGDGPGEGRADGSGGEEEDEEDEDKKKKKPSKKNIHKRDKLNLKEEKNKMGDEEETKLEESTESTEETEEETKDEEGEESKEEGSDDEAEENPEVKALKEEVGSMKKELTEIKALLKKPVRKSKVEVEDKSENFVEEKSQNPLDLIA